MNLTYAGTHLTNGKPDNDTSCVTAFDQAGFMMGTSASLFNVSLTLMSIVCGPCCHNRDLYAVCLSKYSTLRITPLEASIKTGRVCSTRCNGS